MLMAFSNPCFVSTLESPSKLVIQHKAITIRDSFRNDTLFQVPALRVGRCETKERPAHVGNNKLTLVSSVLEQ